MKMTHIGIWELNNQNRAYDTMQKEIEIGHIGDRHVKTHMKIESHTSRVRKASRQVLRNQS